MNGHVLKRSIIASANPTVFGSPAPLAKIGHAMAVNEMHITKHVLFLTSQFQVLELAIRKFEGQVPHPNMNSLQQYLIKMYPIIWFMFLFDLFGGFTTDTSPFESVRNSIWFS